MGNVGGREKCGLCKAQCVQYTIAHVWRGSPTVTLSKHGSRPRGFSGTPSGPPVAQALVAPGTREPTKST